MNQSILLVSCAVVLAAPRAHATPLFETLGAAASTGGFAPVASDPSSASAYFNPAMLEEADDRLDVGVGVLSEQISMTLDGRPMGHDIPLAVGARDAWHKS